MDDEYVVESTKKEPHFFSQEDLNELVRDLSLFNDKPDVLGSRLKQRNLLQKGTKFSAFRSRHKDFGAFFKQENKICFCTGISGLMHELGNEHVAQD